MTHKKITEKNLKPGKETKSVNTGELMKVWNYFPKYVGRDSKLFKTTMSKNFGLSETEFEEMKTNLLTGDESIFERIFLKHFDNCISYLVKNNRIDRELAYDITMETLIDFRKKLINNKINYGNLRFLFTKMASQKHLKQIREDKKKKDLSSLYEDESLEPDLEIMEKALDQLGAACKDLLKLNYYEKMSLKDIAVLKNVQAATLRKQKQRCLFTLKNLFRKYSL